MANLDSNWDLDKFETSSAEVEVKQFHLCALSNDFNEGDEAGEPPTNHWVLCLEISQNSSVMIDMAPGYGRDGLRGKIEVASFDKRYTSETLRVFSFATLQTITVSTVS
ncbi:hypothetical protein F5Y16DRAFT_378796 [Xylariaceae sp. FL0255]|nr:hypothetical protein F5Y16DRAFT_378796 [Xylariaceae sp. FL0255]